MANIINFTGFETGDFTECLFVSGTASVQSSTKRTGNYAVRTNPAAGVEGYFSLGQYDSAGVHTTFNLANTFIKFYFRYATKPAAASEIICQLYDIAPTLKISLFLKSDGTILVSDSAGTTLGTTTKVLSANTWYRIELKCGTGSSAAYMLLIDGVIELSGTGDLLTSNGALLNIGKVYDSNNNAVDFYYDDISIASNTFPGPSEVKILKPNANGTFTAWTGDYTSVDEIPHDSDTTTVTSSTNTNVESVNVESSSDVGITADGINAVKSFVVARRSGLVVNAKIRLRSGSTNDDTSGTDLDTVYSHYGKVYNTNPNGSVPWLRTSLDSVEVGIVHNQAEAREALCTSMGVMVDFVTYVTGVSSLVSTETFLTKTQNIIVGTVNPTCSTTLTVQTHNFYDIAKTLTETTSLAVEADNIVNGFVTFSNIAVITPLGLISLDEKITLESVTELIAESNNNVNGQILLNIIGSLQPTSLSEVQVTLDVTTSLFIQTGNLLEGGEITSDGQETVAAEANLSTNTASVCIGSVGLIASGNTSILSERVGNGSCSKNVTTALSCKGVNLTGNAINFNAVSTLLTESKNHLINSASKNVTVTVNVLASPQIYGRTAFSSSGNLNVLSSRIFNNTFTLNNVVNIYSIGGYDIFGRASLINSCSISVNLLTEIGVLQYVEKTVYINKLFSKSIKIGVKSG